VILAIMHRPRLAPVFAIHSDTGDLVFCLDHPDRLELLIMNGRSEADQALTWWMCTSHTSVVLQTSASCSSEAVELLKEAFAADAMAAGTEDAYNLLVRMACMLVDSAD
jgi:hypothetical protein